MLHPAAFGAPFAPVNATPPSTKRPRENLEAGAIWVPKQIQTSAPLVNNRRIARLTNELIFQPCTHRPFFKPGQFAPEVPSDTSP